MAWKPPKQFPPTPTKPTGVGLVRWLGNAFKLIRVTAVGWILMFLGFALVPLIIKVMAGLGIGFVTYQLGSYALDGIFSQVQTHVSALPPEVLAFISIAKIPEAISVLFGGLAVRLGMMGFNSVQSAGKMKQMIWQA